MSYSNKPDWLKMKIAEDFKVKEYEAEFLKRPEYKPFPAYLWNSFGVHPRLGVKWEQAEIDYTNQMITNLLIEKEKLNLNDLCWMAWVLGRSANSVKRKLQKDILGFPKFNLTFNCF